MIKNFDYKGSVISVWNDFWGGRTVCVDEGTNHEEFKWEVDAIAKGKKEIDEMIRECYGSYEEMVRQQKEHEELLIQE